MTTLIKPNWLTFKVEEISFVDIPAVPDADIVALKRRFPMGKPSVPEIIEQVKAIHASGVLADTLKQGNLQALVDSFEEWAGGTFTGCMSALEGKEGITDPAALCAWLHHEATGNWPAED